MTITAGDRTSKYRRVKGTYSKNNGSFVGMADFDSLKGEWKDDTGTGTLELSMGSSENRRTFVGDWIRQTGTGPAQVKLRGGCVESNAARLP
jgi:hypothetical protein